MTSEKEVVNIDYTALIKDESSQVKEREHTNEPLTLSMDDPNIQAIITKALAKFKREPVTEAPRIVIKATWVVQ